MNKKSQSITKTKHTKINIENHRHNHNILEQSKGSLAHNSSFGLAFKHTFIFTNNTLEPLVLCVKSPKAALAIRITMTLIIKSLSTTSILK